MTRRREWGRDGIGKTERKIEKKGVTERERER